MPSKRFKQEKQSGRRKKENPPNDFPPNDFKAWRMEWNRVICVRQNGEMWAWYPGAFYAGKPREEQFQKLRYNRSTKSYEG